LRFEVLTAVLTSGLLRCVDWYIVIKVSEKHAASTFKTLKSTLVITVMLKIQVFGNITPCQQVRRWQLFSFSFTIKPEDSLQSSRESCHKNT